MKVEKKINEITGENNIYTVTFPDDEHLYVSESRWDRFVETVKYTAGQFEADTLKPFISVLDVFTIVRDTAITSVELTEEGEYDLK